jgi:hypothetical protein
MATTKALKAKTTARRAAKPAKATAFSRRRCNVVQLGRDYDALESAEWYLRCVRWDKADADERQTIRRKLDAILGAQRGLIEAAAQDQAFSNDGAAFQTMVLVFEVGELATMLAGRDEAFRHLDRAVRLCHSLMRYFEGAHGVRLHDLGYRDLVGGNTDPKYLSAQAMSDYTEYMAKAN